MKTLSSFGRIIYAFPFIIFGALHFTNASGMAQMLKGWPLAEGFVYLSGLGLLLAGVSIIVNIKARLATLLLALFLLITIVVLHLPGVSNGNQMSTTMFLKDMALMGAALTYSGMLKN